MLEHAQRTWEANPPPPPRRWRSPICAHTCGRQACRRSLQYSRRVGAQCTIYSTGSRPVHGYSTRLRPVHAYSIGSRPVHTRFCVGSAPLHVQSRKALHYVITDGILPHTLCCNGSAPMHVPSLKGLALSRTHVHILGFALGRRPCTCKAERL